MVMPRTRVFEMVDVIRKQPCGPCLKEFMAGAECWNYGKEPDPANPEGPWKIVGWFHCHRGIQDENSRGYETGGAEKVLDRPHADEDAGGVDSDRPRFDLGDRG